MMFVFLVPYCLGGIAGPALQATISGHVPPNAQGELQGSLTSLMSVTAIIRAAAHDQSVRVFHQRASPGAFFRAHLLYWEDYSC